MKQGSCLARLFDKSMRDFYARNQYCSLNALPRLGQFLKGEKMKITDHKTTAADMAALCGNLIYKGIYDIPLSFCYRRQKLPRIFRGYEPERDLPQNRFKFYPDLRICPLDSLEIR